MLGHDINVDTTTIDFNTPLVPEKSQAGYKYFCDVWRTDKRLRKIRIRRHIRFARCNTCVQFRELRAHTRDLTTLKTLNRDEYEHYVFVRQEREGYYLRRRLAIRYPKHFLSLIIDGADQGAYALPYFHESCKESIAVYKAHVHMYGILSHGRTPQVVTVLPTVKQGSNATIDCLFRALVRTKRMEGSLPPVIFLQLDNTTKQCKNSHLLAFAAYLVHFGVVREVVLSFLPVGHTHEDIDQLFACFSKWLKAHSAASRPKLEAAMMQAYTSTGGKSVRVDVTHLDRLANLSHWLEPHTMNLTSVTGDNKFTSYRQFRIWTREDGRVHVDARKRSDTPGDSTDYNGLRNWEASTPVFKDTEETRAFLEAGPFPNYTTVVDDEDDEEDGGGYARSEFPVPNAQLAAPIRYERDSNLEAVDAEHRRKGFKRLCDTRHIIDNEDKTDLGIIMAAIDSKAPLPFNWPCLDVEFVFGMAWKRQKKSRGGVGARAALRCTAVYEKYPIGSIVMATGTPATEAEGGVDDGSDVAVANEVWLGYVAEIDHKCPQSGDLGFGVKWYYFTTNSKGKPKWDRIYSKSKEVSYLHIDSVNGKLSGTGIGGAGKLTAEGKAQCRYWEDKMAKQAERANQEHIGEEPGESRAAAAGGAKEGGKSKEPKKKRKRRKKTA